MQQVLKKSSSTFLAVFEEIYQKVEGSGEQISEIHRCLMLLDCLEGDYYYLAREIENCADEKFRFTNL